MNDAKPMINLLVLRSLDGAWVSFAALKARLESAGYTMSADEPDALTSMWRCLESFEAEGWVETSERIHGCNVIEYRLSPIGMQKKAQFHGI